MILLSIVLPVFSLILLGKLVFRFGLLDVPGLRGLTDLVFWVIFPALLFISIAQQPPGRTLSLAGVYFAVAVPVYGGALLLGRLVLNARLAHGAVFALNATYGNMGLLGIPIVSAAYGEDGLAVLLALLGFHAATLLPLATVLIEMDRNKGAGLAPSVLATARSLVRNPVILGIAAGYIWRATGLPVPVLFAKPLTMLAQAAAPLALICLGASLPPLSGRAVWGEALMGAAIKLLVLPLCVAAAAWGAGFDGRTRAVMILAAALPTGANAFMLARRAGALLDASASTVVIGTVLSIVTLTLVLTFA